MDFIYFGLEIMHVNHFFLAYSKYFNISFLWFASIVT